jgi:predicted nucleic acid-binding protein
MRALIDTNVILDVLLNRQEFLPASADVWIANERGLFEGFVSAITPVNVYYLARSSKKDKKVARQLVSTVLDAFQVCSVSQEDLRAAIPSNIVDYEDAVQVVSALNVQVDVIVTRDLKDYVNSPIRVMNPAEFVQQLA